MIKKLKIGSLVAALALSVGFLWAGSALAVAPSISYSSNTHVSIGGYDYVITAGSAATSVAVSGNTIAVVVPTGSTFTLTSVNGATFSNNGGLTTTCGAGSSIIVVPDTSSATVTITPFVGTFYCTGGSGGLTSGGGSGSVTSTVAQSTSPVTITVSPGVTETTSSPGCSGGNKYNTSTGALCINNTVTQIPGCGNRNTGFSTATGQSCVGNNTSNVSSTTGSAYDFGAVVLKKGSKGAAVMELQKFLNATLNLGLVVDGKLGPKTIAVIKQWQKDHGLTADGLVGPKTKAKMNASI